MILMTLAIDIKLFVWVNTIAITLANNNICNSSGNLTTDEVWKLFAFNTFEAYFILIIGSISLIAIVLALLTWIWIPSFMLPLDIVFIILCASLLNNLTLIIEAAYQLSQQDQPISSGFIPFCTAIGFINMVGYTTSVYYNALFCGALSYSIRNTLRKPFLSRFKLHLMCTVVIVTALIIIIFTTNSNSPFTDVCVFKMANSSSLGLFLLHLLIFSFCLYSLKKFRSRIPQNSFFQKISHFRYYYIYMIIFCIVEGVNSLTFLIGNLSCQTSASNINVIIQVVNSINNVLIIILSFASALLRIGHPLVLQKIKDRFHYNEIQSQPIDNQSQELSWMTSLVDSIKGSQVLSFIQAILINYIENTQKQTNNLTPYHFRRQYSFVIDEHVTSDYIKRRVTNRESHFTRRISNGITTLVYQVLIYTPEFYSWIIRNERINLFSSFDIRKNLQIVKQQSFTEGGKSGQFFFGTYDHKFIFKTIQQEEADVLLNKTQQFYNYFSKNSDSLLIKIIGLYKFQRKDVKDEIVYLIIMKNITMTLKTYNLRVYDIKGSIFNRSTLREKKISVTDDKKLRRYTLKDKDFHQIQGKIDIDPIEAQNLKKHLIIDFKFLAELGVMDYSLLIVKRQGPPSNQKWQYRSTKDQNIFYNFGIIDYLQEWTLKRKAERILKTMITSDQVTANSPVAYSERLIGLIDQII